MVTWDGDGLSTDAKSSIDVLLESLTAPGNCVRWQRASNRWPIEVPSRREPIVDGTGAAPRETTAQLCQEIVAKLHAAGLTHRKMDGVRTKVASIEKSFWGAVAWKRARGAANVTATEGGRAAAPALLDVQIELYQRCRFYDTLAPMMLAPHQAGGGANGDLRVDTSAPAPAADASSRYGTTSLDVLLDWLAAPGNYARWRATTNDACARARLLAEIACTMRHYGLRDWPVHVVRTRIVELERSVHAAVAWRNRYGPSPGRLASIDGGFELIRRGMTRVCPHCERIGPAMVPLVNSQRRSTARSVGDVVVPALTRWQRRRCPRRIELQFRREWT